MGSYIKTFSHIDSGANIFGAIKTSLAHYLAKAFGISFLRLPTPITPTGYNGSPGVSITSALLLTLTLDNRRINFPFLVTDLGGTDVLIGRKFMEHYDIAQRYIKGNMRLEWPVDMEPQQFFDQRIRLPKGPQPASGYSSPSWCREKGRDSLKQDRYRRQRAAEASMASMDTGPRRTKKGYPACQLGTRYQRPTECNRESS